MEYSPLINLTLLTSAIAPIITAVSQRPSLSLEGKTSSRQWLVFIAAGFLVSVPVFVQAPLVRLFPEISLLLTVGWLALSCVLLWRPQTALWGDLLLGFTGSWLAGSLYWGWLRWEPFLHLPVEAIGVPLAIACLVCSWGKIGSYFYLGSLLGTAITDLYFYLTGLIPHWRQLMQVEPALALPIFQSAVAQIETPWGIGCAVALIATLLIIGLWPWRYQDLHGWAFSGAVLCTLLVDGLFWLVATAV